jgi:hypothetical protein
MTYDFPIWEYAADANFLKLHHLQNAARNIDSHTLVHNLHMAFKIPYDHITKLCSTQTEVTINNLNPNVHGTGQGEARHRKYKRLKLGGSQAYDSSAD